jgi:hypothetical protein
MTHHNNPSFTGLVDRALQPVKLVVVKAALETANGLVPERCVKANDSPRRCINVEVSAWLVQMVQGVEHTFATKIKIVVADQSVNARPIAPKWLNPV